MEYSDEQILEMIHGLDKEKQSAFLYRLSCEVEEDRPRSIDEWDRIFNDEKTERDVKDLILRSACRFYTRIRMASHYVQSFETLRPCNEGQPWFDRKQKEKWAPYLPETARRLGLSEESVLDICCLFYCYFIPMAAEHLNVSMGELGEQIINALRDTYINDQAVHFNGEKNYEKALFQLSAVKDLAKLYMLQRMKNRCSIFTLYDYTGYAKAYWRELLSKSDIPEAKRKRMIYGVWDELTPEIKQEELMHSRHCTYEAEARKDAVLSAFSDLEQGKDYSFVMEKNGITFDEVRAIDCFVKKDGGGNK